MSPNSTNLIYNRTISTTYYGLFMKFFLKKFSDILDINQTVINNSSNLFLNLKRIGIDFSKVRWWANMNPHDLYYNENNFIFVMDFLWNNKLTKIFVWSSQVHCFCSKLLGLKSMSIGRPSNGPIRYLGMDVQHVYVIL